MFLDSPEISFLWQTVTQKADVISPSTVLENLDFVTGHWVPTEQRIYFSTSGGDDGFFSQKGGKEGEAFTDDDGAPHGKGSRQGCETGTGEALEGLTVNKGSVRELKVELRLGHGSGWAGQLVYCSTLACGQSRHKPMACGQSTATAAQSNLLPFAAQKK